MLTTMNVIGKRVRARRRAASLSQVTVAALARITQSCLSKIETGESEPSFATIAAIAKALDTTIDDLAAAPRATSRRSASTKSRAA